MKIICSFTVYFILIYKQTGMGFTHRLASITVMVIFSLNKAVNNYSTLSYSSKGLDSVYMQECDIITILLTDSLTLRSAAVPSTSGADSAHSDNTAGFIMTLSFPLETPTALR